LIFAPWFIFPDALHRAKKRAEDLADKLEVSEKARTKDEKDAAAVGDLCQRLHDAENALCDRISQQIARENSIVDRLDTQNRRFVSKFFLSLVFVSSFVFFSDIDDLILCSSREDG
jgi:hypothetical protein